MSIFSLRHTWLGKSHPDYKPGVAKDHANYITRQSACTRVIGARMPTDRQALKAWLDRQETGDRKNARIVDKLLVALPLELTPDQREDLLRRFCDQASQGRAGWLAAIHDRGKDAHNPHAHIMFRDRDFQTGRRVMMTTERGSTERFREMWEIETNRALEGAGHEARVDRRTLAAQGIDRKASRHTGPENRISWGLRHRTDEERQAARQAREERQRRGRSASGRSGPDWTDKGSMVAQQWSAMRWLKQGGEGRKNTEAKAHLRLTLTDEQKERLTRDTPDTGRGGLTR